MSAREKLFSVFIVVATLVVALAAMAPVAMAGSAALTAADEILAGHVAGEAVPEGLVKYHHECWWWSIGLSGTADYRKVSRDAFKTGAGWVYTGRSETVVIGWPGRERFYTAWQIDKGLEHRWVLC